MVLPLKSMVKKHDFWRSQKNTLIVVPRHDNREVPQGTLNDILNKARNQNFSSPMNKGWFSEVKFPVFFKDVL